MSFTRKVSLITGVAFLITFAASIPAAFYFYAPVLDNADYILGAGADTRIGWGAVLEVILVVANIATAVALYPVVKRQNEGLALGYVAARTFESAMIAVGIIAMLAVVTLRQELAGAAAPPLPSLSGSRSSRSTTGRSCSGRAWWASGTACCWAT